MNEPAEHLFSQAILEKLGPLVSTLECQLKDLTQGQTILQSNVAQLSSELDLTQTELDKAHDTFARLPHYIAKLTAMKNMITSTTILSRKLQRRVDQVIIGREKQAAKMKVVRAKEQAYDQAVAAVHTSTSTSSHPQWSGSSSSPSKPISPLMANAQSQDHPLALLGSTGSKSLELDINASSSAARLPPPSPPPPSAGLPFPLPAKPAFPVISTMRSSNRSESPPLSISPHFSPLLLGRTTATAASPGRDFANSPTSSLTGGNDSDVQQQQLSERVDRFPQISSTAQDDEASKNLSTQFASEVEVVRLRRKKKLSKSSANTSNSSIVSVSTTASVKRSQSVKSKGKGAAKITTTKSTLSVQQAEPSQ